MKRFVASYSNEEGQPSWSDVASAMAQQFDSGHRNTKACRERWFHHLRPGLTDAEWTPAEEVILFQLQALHGNKWTNIAEHLPGRSDQVSFPKNRGQYRLARQLRAATMRWPISTGVKTKMTQSYRPAVRLPHRVCTLSCPQVTVYCCLDHFSCLTECQEQVLCSTSTRQPPKEALP